MLHLNGFIPVGDTVGGEVEEHFFLSLIISTFPEIIKTGLCVC